MLSTIHCPLPPDDALVQTIKVYNEVVQYVLDIGWEIRENYKGRLRQKTYYEVRKKYSLLQSSLVLCARDQVSTLLKLVKKKGVRFQKQVKDEYGAISYNQRTFTVF
ncbi:MAG: hypothetical protein ACXAC8_00870 [Candidatus Hodarchaeales archaeon]|jgi:predicted transposase